ncbi:MAG: GAF domain-containing protein [Prevotella sp.]|jgi:GAF domain-containing protein|nr:GAF domain-containing protein [Prevotella sp.]
MKREQYQLITEQIRALIEGETDKVAVMANVCAVIHETMGFWWTGFYRVKGDELVLGPFQGPVACMHIGYGKGVCGTAWKEQHTIVVPDVEQFPGHIACSSLSRSEIVVPVFTQDGSVSAVLDIDSKELATFDTIDKEYLEEICKLLSPLK